MFFLRMKNKRGYAAGLSLAMPVICAFLLFNGFNPKPTPTPRPHLPFTAEQLTEMHDQGEYFVRGGLGDLGLPLMKAAHERSARITGAPELHYHFSSSYALELARNGNPAEAQRVLQSLIAWSQETASGQLLDDLLRAAPEEPAIRHRLVLAMGYIALKQNRPSEANALATRSGRMARAQADFAAEAESLLLEAQSLFDMNRFDQIADTAQDAVARFRVTGQPIMETRARLLISRTYARVGNYRLSRIEKQDAMNVIPDYSVAPMVELDRNAENLDRILTEHHQLAIRGQYHTARNEVIALIRLLKHRNSIASSELQEKVRQANLYEGPLIVYLTRYTLALGASYTAKEMLALARSYENAQPGLRVRSEYAWSMGQLLFDLDRIGEAERQLVRAENLVEQVAAEPDFLRIGIYELRSFIEIKKQNRKAAVKAMEQASGLARQAGMEDRLVRQQNILQHMSWEDVAWEKISSQFMIDADSVARSRQREEAQTTAEPEIFRTVFARQYPEPRSAAESIMETDLVRPTPPPVRIRLTAADRIRMGQYDRAVEILEKEIEQKGATVHRLMMLGSCYYQLRKWPEAQSAYQRVLEMEPENKAARQRLEFVSQQVDK